jgi:hypothetical protein
LNPDLKAPSDVSLGDVACDMAIRVQTTGECLADLESGQWHEGNAMSIAI